MDNEYNTVTGNRNIKSGIYIMVNKNNGKAYVGQSTKNIYKRSRHHKLDIHNEIGSCIKKNEFSMFNLSLYSVDKNHLDEVEAMFIKKLECLYPDGYNIDPNANIRSFETTKRMSLGMKGIKKGPMSKDHKRKIKEKCDERKVKRLLANNERQQIMDIRYSKKQVGYTPLNTNKGAHYE